MLITVADKSNNLKSFKKQEKNTKLLNLINRLLK